MSTASAQTYNFLVPVDGSTHAVFQYIDLESAGSEYVDWKTFSTNHFTFRPQGVFIDNTSGTAPAVLTTNGTPFSATMPTGCSGWVSFPSTANLVTTVSGNGSIQLTFVDYPVINSIPVDSNGIPYSAQSGTTEVVNAPNQSLLVIPQIYDTTLDSVQPISMNNQVPTRIASSSLADTSNITLSSAPTSIDSTITTGGTTQVLISYLDPPRGLFYFQNLSSDDLFVGFYDQNTQTNLPNPIIQVSAGASLSFTLPSLPTCGYTVYGATTGQAFGLTYM